MRSFCSELPCLSTPWYIMDTESFGNYWRFWFKITTFFTLLCLIFPFLTNSQDDFDYEYVTCGSVIKLLNTRHNVRLHSHDIKYGSGSGQQSVTAVGDTTDQNSYWQIKGKQDTQCSRGSPIKCGSTIRLMHVATRRNLHSHSFQSPLSHNQEVSCFGEDGDGDAGDNWVVVCSTQLWRRNEGVRLKHVATEKFLTVTGDVYGRPIHGQKEVCAHSTASQNNNWKSMEGIYVKPNEGDK